MRAVVARLAAEADVFGQADVLGDPRARRAADERVQALCQLALGAFLAAVKPIGDAEAEYAIAEELQPLVIALGPDASVGEGFDPQGFVGNREADPLEPPPALAKTAH